MATQVRLLGDKTLPGLEQKLNEFLLTITMGQLMDVQQGAVFVPRGWLVGLDQEQVYYWSLVIFQE